MEFGKGLSQGGVLELNPLILMRIGIEAQRISRTKKHGIDFAALELIRGLQAVDKVNEYVIFTNEGEELNRIPSSDNFRVVSKGGSYPIWEQFHLPKMIKKEGIELLHCTSNTAPIRLEVPLIVTVHDLIYFETHPFMAVGYSPYQRFGNYYRRWVVSRILESARRILTVSQFELSNFVRMFPDLPEGKVQVIYNSIGSHFQPISDEDELNRVRERYQLPARFIIMLGNTDPKKNTANAVRSFVRSIPQIDPSIQLVLGDLNSRVIESWLSSEERAQAQNRIHFTGYIDNLDLPAILSMADLLYYPSKRESFGIPILEGMASGCPVISSNTSSMPEIGGSAARYVNPEDVEHMHAVLVELINNEPLRREMRESGLIRARDFSKEHIALQLLEQYTEIYHAEV